MAKSIKALYEDGVFKPLTKIHLRNRQRVKLTVVESETPSKRIKKTVRSQRAVTKLKEITSHPAYRIVGLFKSGLNDLSQDHDKYLYPPSVGS